MKPLVRIGDATDFVLSKAILLYTARSERDAFATVHPVAIPDVGVATLGPGEVVSMSFLATLAEALGSRLAPEFLPPNVICRTPHLIVWWTPATQRTLYYRKDSELGHLNGRKFPIPALVWRLSGGQLHVRALKQSERPDSVTPLCVAPFWNTNEDGLVCQGTMRRPEQVDVGTLQAWVDGYFGSEFTHAFGARRLTAHKQGFRGLWKQLSGKRSFPPEYLRDAKQTVQQFIEGKRAQDSAAAA